MYIVLLTNLLRPNDNFIADVKVDISSKKLLSRKCFRKCHVTAFMTLPIDPTYYAVKLVYSVYKRVIA